MATVYAPNPDTEGIHAGVEFVSGVGETSNPGALIYFQRAGYRVVESSNGTTETSAAEPLERPAKSAKVDAWRTYAETVGIDYSGLSKDELIAAVDAAQTNEDGA